MCVEQSGRIELVTGSWRLVLTPFPLVLSIIAGSATHGKFVKERFIVGGLGPEMQARSRNPVKRPIVFLNSCYRVSGLPTVKLLYMAISRNRTVAATKGPSASTAVRFAASLKKQATKIAPISIKILWA